MEGSSFLPVEDMRKESTLSLMDFMAKKPQESEIAQLAFRVFYERLAAKLKTACLSVCNHNRIYDGLDEIVFNNTMIKAFNHAGQFFTESKDEDEVILNLRKWLFGIAKNEMLTELKKIKLNQLILVNDIGIYESEQKDDESVIGECAEMSILNQALEILDEKEKGILLMCYQYMEEGSKMPSDIVDRICKVFGVTDANRRQIKTRALKKVKAQILYLQSKMAVK
ncbi:MAG: polymerase, sigma-24 subunit, subfamily [Chitinophagaceae bacterium]|nr:polymerase, sigma-24 subunit, subfamily [Chitinophagaceae bacterium]